MDPNIIQSKLDLNEYTNNSLIDMLLEKLKINSSSNLLIDSTSNKKWTKKQVLDSCLNFADFLINDCKLNKGDIVCFVTNNNDIHAIGLLGVLAAGGVYCSLPVHSTQYEINQNVLTINPSILIGIEENFELLHKTAKQYNFIKGLLVFDNVSANNLKLLVPTVESAFHTPGRSVANLPIRTTLADMATIVLSSGSTGTPKAIIRTNENYLSLVAIAQHREVQPLGPSDIFFSTAFTHFCGQRSLFSAIAGGAQLAVLGDDVSNEAIYTAVHELNVTTIFSVPTELGFLVNNYDKYNRQYLKSLRDVLCAGAPLNTNVHEKLIQLYNFDKFRNLYGMSESGGSICVYLSERNCLPNAQTIGKVMPGFEVKIIDKNDKPLPSDSVGEICLRSKTITPGFLGYSGNFDDYMTSDGFFKTGDLGYYDSNEYFYFVDRSKDVINYMGIIVSPVELENILLSHESVLNAAVIGIESQTDGEIPMAFVVLKSGSHIAEQQLIDYVNSRVNDVKQIRGGLKIVTRFPLTSLGKINKTTLKQLFRDGHL